MTVLNCSDQGIYIASTYRYCLGPMEPLLYPKKAHKLSAVTETVSQLSRKNLLVIILMKGSLFVCLLG